MLRSYVFLELLRAQFLRTDRASSSAPQQGHAHTWVVVNIRVPFWAIIIIRHLIF